MSQELRIDLNPAVFNKVYLPYLEDTHRTQIFYGGSASGKSVFVAQRLVIDLLAGKRNYLVCRAVGRSVKKSVWTEVRKVINDWDLEKFFKFRIADLVITCVNGYSVTFVGLDDVEKLKSIVPEKGGMTDIWVEEATEVSKPVIKLLLKRQRGGDPSIKKRITLSFNPILKSHWIYKEYFKPTKWTNKTKRHSNPELSILKTTYKDNRFLTEGDIEDLENESDKYMFNVYSLGNWGVLGHRIFDNWKQKNLSAMSAQWTNRRAGLDFGYATDPAAAIFIHYDKMRKIIYVYRETGDTKLTNPQLAKLLKPELGKDRITADSAEPKSITELRGMGVNIQPARKGKDSVNNGINWLRTNQIIVDVNCVETIGELGAYVWKENKNGEPISPPTPVDRNNHFIDALRYAMEGDMVKPVKVGAATVSNYLQDSTRGSDSQDKINW